MEMALKMALKITPATTNKEVFIFSDSQAALMAMRRPRMPSGQVFLRGCVDRLQELEDRGAVVQFRWTPAHQGIPGNEIADSQAKQAAQADISPSEPNNLYIQLASAVKRRIRQEAKAAWALAWAKEKSGRATNKLLEAPTKKVLDFWNGQRRVSSSTMLQIRTGIIGLNQYLSKIKVRDSPFCDCGLDYEMPQHVVMECPRFEDIRKEIWEELERTGVSMTLSWLELLQERAAVPAITSFMEKSRLLGQFHAVDPEAWRVEPPQEQLQAEPS